MDKIYSKLVISLDNPTISVIPYSHQYLVYSNLLKNIKEVDPSLSGNIHGATVPLFVMSQLIPSGYCKFKKEGFYSKRVMLILSSRDENMLKVLNTILSKGKYIDVGPTKLQIFSDKLFKIKISNSVVSLVTRSPVLLKDKNGKYVRYGDPLFEKLLIDSIERKASKILGTKENIHGLNIVYGKPKLVRLNDIQLPCSIIKFVISCNEDILQTILSTGIGKSPQLGFGMVDFND